MAKVYDVPADVLISKLTETLKTEDITPPSWSGFVKTGSHANRPPQNPDWWHVRCASLLRKVYLHGPIGIKKLRSLYGGARGVGYGAAYHRDAGGVIIKMAIHQLEKLGYIEKVAGKGRVISRQGMKKLDRLASDILTQLTNETPQLKVYS